MKAPERSAILLNDMHRVLNEHDLSFRESFMALSYLTAVVGRAGGLSIDQINDAIKRAYEIDISLDERLQ